MKTYVATSGTIFALLVLAHLLRALEEGWHLAREPVFILFTLAPAVLAVWAFRVYAGERAGAHGNSRRSTGN